MKRAEREARLGPRRARAETFFFSSSQVLKWYQTHGLDAIPVHPKEAAIENISTIASVFDIHEPALTSISVITPPHVSLPIIKTALLELGVAAVWLQVRCAPGSCAEIR